MSLKSGQVFFIAAAVILSVAAFQRNIVWSSDIALWSDAARKADGKARPHANLGIAYDQEGDMDKAESEYKKAVSMEPSYLAPYGPLAVLYGKKGNVDKAVEIFLWMIPRLPFKDYKAHTGLGVAYKIKGLLKEAEKELLEAVRINPNDEAVRYNLASLYEQMGLKDEALKHRREIARIRRGE